MLVYCGPSPCCAFSRSGPGAQRSPQCVPLALTSVVCEALMVLLGIGVKVATPARGRPRSRHWGRLCALTPSPSLSRTCAWTTDLTHSGATCAPIHGPRRHADGIHARDRGGHVGRGHPSSFQAEYGHSFWPSCFVLKHGGWRWVLLPAIGFISSFPKKAVRRPRRPCPSPESLARRYGGQTLAAGCVFFGLVILPAVAPNSRGNRAAQTTRCPGLCESGNASIA